HKLSSSLTINGNGYILVDSIQPLAGDITANPVGKYALAKDLVGAPYKDSPIRTTFNGIFEAIGHTLRNLNIQAVKDTCLGLFSSTGSAGVIRDINLRNVSFYTDRRRKTLGSLVGCNGGTVVNASAQGDANTGKNGSDVVGGLVGSNEGTIVNS